LMYDPDSDVYFCEYVEIYNTTTSAIDLTGWVLDDDDGDPLTGANIAGGTVPGRSTAVLYIAETNQATFEAAWGTGLNLIPVTDWSGMSGGGDTVGLWDSFTAYDTQNFNNTIDTVDYDDTAPWPVPDGKASIQLAAPNNDNGASWVLSVAGQDQAWQSSDTGEGDENNQGADVGSPGTIPALNIKPDADDVLISEILYNPASTEDNDWEFVELYNTTGTAFDITNWEIDDDDDPPLAAANIPGGTLPPGGTVVLFNSNTSLGDMEAAWSSTPRFVPVSDWSALSNGGDRVGVWGSFSDYNAQDFAGVLDDVDYDDSGDWPSDDGVASIYLTDLDLSNDDGTNWALSQDGVAGAYTSNPAGDNSETNIASPGIAPINAAPQFTDLAGGASYVLGDPTQPSFTGPGNGFSFTVTDDATAANDITVTVENNSDPSVIDNSEITLVTVDQPNGEYRLDLGTPVGNVGLTEITLRATDDEGAFFDTIFYVGVSQGAPGAIYPTGAADASAAAPVDAGYMFVADDEDQTLRLYDRDSSGAPVAAFDFTDDLDLTDFSGGTPREVDIEGAARVGNRIYWMGSHGNASDGDDRPNRERSFATDLSGSGAAATLSFVGYYADLETDLIAWDDSNGHGLGAGFLGFAASAAPGVPPAAPDGFNMEGLAFAPGSTSTAYIGFRAPLLDTTDRDTALIVPVTNFDVIAAGGTGPATFGAPILLDLDGLAIRSLACDNSGCLIVAGSADDAGAFQIYSWSGNAADAPLPRDVDLTNLNPEALVEVPAFAIGEAFQLVSDNGDTDFYGTGDEAKDLPADGLKKFRVDEVTLGGVASPLDNAGFEEIIDPSNWTINGNDKIFGTGQAFEGDSVFLFSGNSAVEFVSQSVTVSGATDDVVILRLRIGGQNVASGGNIGAQVELLDGVSTVDLNQCVTGQRGTFNWQVFTCQITAPAAYDTIHVTIGWQGVASGFFGIDAVELDID
ncbi:MAG: lamin tail domain-containing protein, partial [Anaerolineae bacterium]